MPSRARRNGASPVMSRPWNVTLPERNGSRPMMLSIVVVFPAPLRPTRQTASFSPTVSDSFRRIRACPRYVSIASTSSMAGSEHGILHGFVPPDLLRAAAGEDLPFVHHDDAIRVPE